METETYQSIQQLKNEIRQYALLGITAVGTYKLTKYNPEARREFMEQLRLGLEKLATENPQLEIKIPVIIEPETPTRIPIQSQ